MANIKTAISIEESIFKQMDALAKKSKISRSRLFTIAAREFIQKNKNLDLLKALNDVYSDLQEPETLVAEMRSNHYKMVKDQW
jgi:metal-responsive CopG/Arc/MetJ family transcriptional regulator